MKNKYSLFSVLFRHFHAIRRSDAWLQMVYAAVLAFLSVMGKTVVVIIKQWLFDGAYQVAAGEEMLKDVFVILAVLLLAQCVFQYVESAFHVRGRNMMKSVEVIFDKSLHEKAARIDPLEYEKKEMLDLVNKAGEGIGHSTSLVFIMVLALSWYFPYYIAMGIYLFLLDPLLALALPLSAVPPIVSLLLRLFYFGKMEDQAAPLRRKYEYYETAVIDRDCFKETRTLGIFRFLDKKYRDTIREYGKVHIRHEKKALRADLALKLLEALTYLLIVFLAVRSLLIGHISIGAFAAVFGNIHSLMGTVAGLLRWHFGNVATNLSAIQGYFIFMDLPERSGSKKLADKAGGIVMENVSFTYPEAQRRSLSNISLEIKEGETVAVVGRNGAGKSTLVRLLSGLYLPESGRVTLGGVDTAELDLKEIYKRTTAVFQDYQRYRYPLELNVRISDTKKEFDKKILEEVLAKADLPLPQSCFPEGIDTMLSREFGGVDLSGGQWQRVAIARGLYREHDILFLDEPTAAIDPLEEKALYEKFMELAAGHTAVLVTHRLGSARLSDRILVMDEGELVAAGTHDELMHSCPVYKNMYESQAGWYV